MITSEEALHLAKKYADRHNGGNEKIYYDTTAGWNAKLSLVSERGAIYVYSDKAFDDSGGYTYAPFIKVGDGSAYVVDLPFYDELIVTEASERISQQQGTVTDAERQFWNNKVSAFLDPLDQECVIFSKTTYV